MAPLKRFEKLSDERQAKFLDAAAEEFAGHGYRRASLNRIITASGVSKGAMYYYFEDKADLFVTVCRRFDARAGLDQVDPAQLDAATFWPALSALTDALFRIIVDNPVYVGIGRAFHELPLDQWHEGRIGEYVEERLARFSGWVERGQVVGVVRGDLSPGVLVHLWMAADVVMDRYALSAWDEADEAERRRLVAMQLGMMKRMFLPNLLEDRP